jgi:hypothetical protein
LIRYTNQAQIMAKTVYQAARQNQRVRQSEPLYGSTSGQWCFTSRTIVSEGYGRLSLNIGSLPAALTALPLPRPHNYKITITDRAGSNFFFLEDFPHL